MKIKAVPPTKVGLGQWISVTDRLPEEDDWAIDIPHSMMSFILVHDKDLGWSALSKHEWDKRGQFESNVTHWMKIDHYPDIY